jgi:hypothetical protein
MNPSNPIPQWAVMAAYLPCHSATFFRDQAGRFRLGNGRFAPRWQTRSLEPNAGWRIERAAMKPWGARP